MASYDRIKGETSQHFEAFAAYRDLGSSRTLKQATIVVYGSDANKRRMAEWSRLNNWVQRCEDYDDDMDRIRQDENVDAIREMTKRHAQYGLLLQQRALERLQATTPDGDSVMTLPASEVAKFIDLGIKVEREARGVAGTTISVQTTHKGEAPGDTAKVVMSTPEGRELAYKMMDLLSVVQGETELPPDEGESPAPISEEPEEGE